MSRGRKYLIVVLAGAAALCAIPSSAAAADICVGTSPMCAGLAEPFTEAGLLAAFDAAKDGSHPGADRIVIAAGTITLANTPIFSGPAGQPLQVIGQGVAQTHIAISPTVTTSEGSGWFLFDTSADSGVSNLSLDMPAASKADTAMVVDGGTFDHVVFNISSNGPKHTGMRLFGSDGAAVIKNSTFIFPDNPYEVLGMEVRRSMTISDSQFIGFGGPLVTGAQSTLAAANAVFRRVLFTGIPHAGIATIGALKFNDTLVDLGTLASAIAFTAKNTSAITSFTSAAVNLHSVTIVGTGNAQIGGEVESTTDGTTSHLGSISASDSIFDLRGTGSLDGKCTGHITGIVTALASFGAINSLIAQSKTDTAFACAKGFADSKDSVATPPAYVDFEGGNYRPAAGSPQIDSGYPDATSPEPMTDLAGNPRFVDGDGDGKPTIDMGAYEYQPPPPSSPPATVAAPPVISLSGSVKKAFTLKGKGFASTKATATPRITITSDTATTVNLSLFKSKGGYKSGSKCVSKKPKTGKAKRCDLAIKGTVPLAVKAGAQSYGFGGKWNKTKLKAGNYKLYATVAGVKVAKGLTFKLAEPPKKKK